MLWHRIALLMTLGWIVHSATLNHIDGAKDFLHERKALAPELNAYTEWKAAEKLWVPLPDDLRTALIMTGSLNGQRPSLETLSALQSWANSNAPPLRLIERSLLKNNAQIPPWNLAETGPFVISPAKITQTRIFLADQAARSGDQITATNLLLGNFKFAQLLRDAEVPLIHYLVASAGRSWSEKALVRWLSFSAANAEMIRAVLLQMPELMDEVEAYKRVLRVEFTDFMMVETDVKQIARVWVEPSRTNELVMAMQPEEMRVPLLVVHDPRLMALHPKPLDEANLSYSATRFRSYLAAAQGPWERKLYEALLNQTVAARAEYLKDLQPLLQATSKMKLPLSAANAKKVAGHYLRLDNPVGRYWQSSDSTARTFITTFRARTERNVTRALLALRIFELEKGRRPGSLEELVEVRLLNAVPMDLFANAPFHYSPDTGILWSVGEDGVDDGGKSGTSLWMEKDAVWKLTPRL